MLGLIVFICGFTLLLLFVENKFFNVLFLFGFEICLSVLTLFELTIRSLFLTSSLLGIVLANNSFTLLGLEL